MSRVRIRPSATHSPRSGALVTATCVAVTGFFAATGILSLTAQSAPACPFCAAVSLTFCEEVGGADVAVIAKLVQLPVEAKASGLGGDGKAKFEIIDVLKGQKALAGMKTFENLYFGNNPLGTTFLVTGVDPPQINWATPIVVSERGRAYLAKALALPKESPDRLAFFQDYLEDEDEMLARDAYDEFAKTPYAGVKALKERMNHDKIAGWIKDPQIAPSRRRLYLTMLGVCGTPADVEQMEKMIGSDDRQVKSGLDALIAAYLTLKGPDGMKLVEDLFLKKKDADYTETYSAIMALRFHGQEEKIVPRERLLEGIHYMLDRPQLADLVIPDLARWQDWSVMDRLVELFKNADDESSWVRVPVINYLRACPLPKAKQYIEELALLDPDAVKKANSFFPSPAAAPAASDKTPAAGDKKPAEPAGKKVSASGPSTQLQANKPIAASHLPAAAGHPQTAASAARGESSQAWGAGSARLSRGAAPKASGPQVGAATILGWMALTALVLAVFLLAILRGGQETA
jgi:hypothetical protein